MRPGQFFTEYLDSLPKLKKQIHPADYMLAERIAELVRREGHFFALPEGGVLTDRKAKTFKPTSGEMFRPPYGYVVLEYTAIPGPTPVGEALCPKRIVIAMDVGGHSVHLLPCLFNEKVQQWVPHIYMSAIKYDKPDMVYHQNGEAFVRVENTYCLPKAYEALQSEWEGDYASFRRRIDTDMRDEVNAYLDFCYVLHNHEVTYDETEPDTAKNRFRRARGKAPLFTYKVLTIGKKKRKSQHLGGTHASPRSHLRRGHYRTSSKGARYWVQPCMVKGETDGFVHKDYVVEGTNHGAI
jgi:hypothetical protein